MNTTAGGMDVGGTDVESIIPIIPLVTGPISLISSAIIIAMILRSKKGLSIIYHRILFGLSVTDILAAAAISVGSLASPKGTTNLFKNFGNTSTCNAQGFFSLFGTIAQPLYSCSLHTYFLCTIKYEMKTEDIQRLFEPFFHCIPILYGITGAIIALVTESINPSITFCWIESLPRRCHVDKSPCIRGGSIFKQKVIFGAIPIITSLVFMTITTILIYCKARKTERNNERHVFRPSEPHSNTNTNLDQPNGANLLRRILSKLRKSLSRHENTLNSRMVLNRMMNYYAAYLLTYLPAIIYQFTAEFGVRSKIFVIPGLVSWPLQGFFTLLVVNHPKYKKIRRLDETKSAFHAFFAAIRSYGRATIGYEITNRTPGLSPIPDNTGNRRNSLLTDPQVTANDAESFEGDHMKNEEHSVNYEEDSE